MALPHDEDLATRKLILQQRSAIQRQMLAIQLKRTLGPALQTADRLQAGGAWAKRHPVLVAGVAAALLAWRPRVILGAAGRAWALWQTWQRVQPVVRRLLDRFGNVSKS